VPPSYLIHPQVELWDAAGGDMKGAMIDDVVTEDWVLRSQWLDHSRARAVVSYALSRRMGRWAPHTRYVELFLHRPSELPASPEQGARAA